MKADMKRDILRRSILELVGKGNMHYTTLEKNVCSKCYQFATSNTFKSRLGYLLDNGYIIRFSRGIYKITLKGRKYLDL